MTIDIRADAAAYYDLDPHPPDDVPFYRDRIPVPDAQVLELGCGTGRVLVPLWASCGYIHGLDASGAMLARCREKLAAAGIRPDRARVERADITGFDLGRTFDLVIAPYRVLQNLETDREVEGLLGSIRSHLRPGGTCILNAFRPNRRPEAMRSGWCVEGETFEWEASPRAGTRVTCYSRRPGMDAERLVLYPELVFRRYEDEVLRDEVVLRIAMRCWYPDELVRLVEAHGFRVVERWGGYAGEAYGEGPELVVQFADGG